jgi:ParB/RepB/Spo0J family partition protein
MATQATTATPEQLARTSAPLTMLVPGDNPRRKKAPDAAIDEMAASMRTPLGVVQPIVVRVHPKQPEKLQIIAGETRFVAAGRAGLDVVPVVVRDWDDDMVLEAQLVENIQRNAMHPIDEGEAFKRLTDRKTNPYTVEVIADKVGKSVRWVYNRLEFTKLIAPLRQAFLDDEITASHAELLARLEPADQERVNNDEEGYRDGLWRWDFLELGEDAAGSRRSAVSVRDLNDWISKNVRLAVDTAAVQHLLPEVEDIMSDLGAERVLQVATTRDLPNAPELKGRFKGVLTRKHWEPAGGRSACDFAERAVIVFGEGQGTTVEVCANKKQCAKHWPNHTPEALERQKKLAAKSEQPRTVEAEQAKRQAAETRYKVLKPALQKAVDGIVGKLTVVTPKVLGTALEALYLDISPKTKPADLASELVRTAVKRRFEECYSHWNLPDLIVFAEGFGVDVKALEQSLAPEGAPVKPAKKAAKTINWKTHFEKDEKKAKRATKKKAAAPAKRKAGKKR